MQVSCILCSHYLFYLIDLLLFDFWSIFQVNSSFYCLCAKLRYSDRKIYATNGTLLCLGSKYARYDF